MLTVATSGNGVGGYVVIVVVIVDVIVVVIVAVIVVVVVMLEMMTTGGVPLTISCKHMLTMSAAGNDGTMLASCLPASESQDGAGTHVRKSN